MTDPIHIPEGTVARCVESMDYIIIRGQTYRVSVNDFSGDVKLKPVDEIPDEYHEKWSDEQ